MLARPPSCATPPPAGEGPTAPPRLHRLLLQQYQPVVLDDHGSDDTRMQVMDETAHLALVAAAALGPIGRSIMLLSRTWQ